MYNMQENFCFLLCGCCMYN